MQLADFKALFCDRRWRGKTQHAAHDVTVPTHVLGCGMQYDIGTQR